jgi:hypothetical protein
MMLVIATWTIVGCSKEDRAMKGSDSTIKVGGIYATPDKDGSWKVARVLALDEHAVHLRFYTDRFAEQPKDVDLAKLKWFIGHAPLAREGFEKEKRVLIKVVPVGEDELEGYRYYLEAMNGGGGGR